MKKNDKQTSISKQARKSMSKVDISFSISLFVLLNIGVLILAFVDPSTLIITIPFVFAPSLFALTAMPIVKTNERKETSTYFAMFKTYFKMFFRGCYRLLIAFLFAYLAFTIIFGVAETIVTSFIIKDEFIAFANSIENLTSFEDILNEYVSFLNSSPKILYSFSIAVSLGLIGGALTFLHRVAVHNVKVHFNLLTNNLLPMPVINQVHKITIRRIYWKFFKDYYKALWFVPIVLFIGLVTGTGCGMLFLEISVERCFVIGLFGALILFIPMAKYFIYCCKFLYQKYSYEYMQTFVNFSLDGLNKMKKDGKINQENSEKFEEFINKTQDDINNKRKENNDK